MKTVVTVLFFVLVVAGTSWAENVAYIFPVGGVVAEGSATSARAALEGKEGILKVQTIIEKHEVVVAFDDAKISLEKIRESLGKAGFTSGEGKKYTLLPAPNWLP